MFNRKISFGKAVGSAVAIGLMLGSASLAQASPLVNGTVKPTITAGAPPDSPISRIDPNVASSRFSGVVSININFNDESYICSGALVGKRQVVSAGHCVDMDGNGTYVDLNAPGSSMLVVFNSAGTYTSIIDASSFAVHKDYEGFNNCPDGSRGCVNDDVAVITLAEDAPASAKIYGVAVNPLNAGTRIIMAGYGTSGDGVNGFYVAPNYYTKRVGENYVDLFDRDDEQGFTGQREVYYADFDSQDGENDTFCTYFGSCTPILANNREAGIGGGDSGGPSFVEMYGDLYLVANNTFSGYFPSLSGEGAFGSYFGGMIMGAYTDFLYDATGGNITFVPEPASAALLGLGSLLMLGSRRRRSAK